MDLDERLRRAGGSADDLVSVLYDHDADVLLALLANPRLTEEHGKVLLSRRDLPHSFLRELGNCERLLRSYEIKLGLARHVRAPRSVALACLGHLYPFDLMRVATTLGAAGEIRKVAEEALIGRLPGLSQGERSALARQASARLASALLLDSQEAVYRIAADNPRLTEEGVLRALRDSTITAGAVEVIARHPRWSLRREVRLAIIRSPGASLARVLAAAEQVARRDLAELAENQAMPRQWRQYLLWLASRPERRNRFETRGEAETGGPTPAVQHADPAVQGLRGGAGSAASTAP